MSVRKSATDLALSKSDLGAGSLFRLKTNSALEGWSELPRIAPGKSLSLIRNHAYWLAPRFGRHKTKADDGLTARAETVFFLTEVPIGKATLVLPLPGATHSAWVETRDGRLGIAWRADAGADTRDLAVAYVATGTKAADLPAEALAAIRPILGRFRQREEKMPAAFLDDFGWCTWDAFYDQVTAADVRRGIATLAKGGITPGFIILDDGWQDANGWRMHSMGTNAKFPNGLAEVVRNAKDRGVRHFGLWHTLHGYWHGIDPRGPIAARHKVVSVPQTTDHFAGWPENLNPPERFTLAPEAMAGFYDAFYAQLAAEGIDFTKVDGQGSTPYFAGETFPISASHEAAQSALQAAVARHLFGGIHCMAQSADIFWRLASAPVVRNSDDFYPDKPFVNQAQHLVFNAYHALFVGLFATPDWDMFHSKHPFATFHAAARALSGGPIYVSDKPGEHDFALLRRLVLPGGSVPRFSQPGLPPPCAIFADPLRDGTPLRLSNFGGVAAALGLFNCRTEPVPSKITARWSPSDLPELVGQDFIAHAPLTSETIRLKRTHTHTESLAAEGGVQVWTVAPVIGGALAPLGLEGYFAAAATVATAEKIGPGLIHVTVRSGGDHLLWSRKRPVSVRIAGKKIKFRFAPSTGLLKVLIAPKGSFSLTVAYR